MLDVDFDVEFEQFKATHLTDSTEFGKAVSQGANREGVVKRGLSKCYSRGTLFDEMGFDVCVRFALLADFRIRPDSDAGRAWELQLQKTQTFATTVWA